MKIHIGCGEKILDGFVNIDARHFPGVDIVTDIRDLGFLGNEKADLIYASHVLEHIGRLEYKNTLKNWFNVIKNKGKLRISVPDLEKVFDHYNKNKNLKVLMGFLYGGQDYTYNYHYCGWDFTTLKDDLLETGFSFVEKYDWRKTEHSHIDDFSQCYIPHMDKKKWTINEFKY